MWFRWNYDNRTLRLWVILRCVFLDVGFLLGSGEAVDGRLYNEFGGVNSWRSIRSEYWK